MKIIKLSKFRFRRVNCSQIAIDLVEKNHLHNLKLKTCLLNQSFYKGDMLELVCSIYIPKPITLIMNINNLYTI